MTEKDKICKEHNKDVREFMQPETAQYLTTLKKAILDTNTNEGLETAR